MSARLPPGLAAGKGERVAEIHSAYRKGLGELAPRILDCRTSWMHGRTTTEIGIVKDAEKEKIGRKKMPLPSPRRSWNYLRATSMQRPAASGRFARAYPVPGEGREARWRG
jgi:hypothetical protein